MNGPPTCDICFYDVTSLEPCIQCGQKSCVDCAIFDFQSRVYYCTLCLEVLPRRELFPGHICESCDDLPASMLCFNQKCQKGVCSECVFQSFSATNNMECSNCGSIFTEDHLYREFPRRWVTDSNYGYYNVLSHQLFKTVNWRQYEPLMKNYKEELETQKQIHKYEKSRKSTSIFNMDSKFIKNVIRERKRYGDSNRDEILANLFNKKTKATIVTLFRCFVNEPYQCKGSITFNPKAQYFHCSRMFDAHIYCPRCFEYLGGMTPSIRANHFCKKNAIDAAKQVIKEKTEGLVKHCPRCDYAIFKDGGCNNMICSQCHTSFRWDTGDITKEGVHFIDEQRAGYRAQVRRAAEQGRPINPKTYPSWYKEELEQKKKMADAEAFGQCIGDVHVEYWNNKHYHMRSIYFGNQFTLYITALKIDNEIQDGVFNLADKNAAILQKLVNEEKVDDPEEQAEIDRECRIKLLCSYVKSKIFTTRTNQLQHATQNVVDMYNTLERYASALYTNLGFFEKDKAYDKKQRDKITKGSRAVTDANLPNHELPAFHPLLDGVDNASPELYKVYDEKFEELIQELQTTLDQHNNTFISFYTKYGLPEKYCPKVSLEVIGTTIDIEFINWEWDNTLLKIY